ncbi:MAG: VWA domain-containing protein [Deltaproteobacteria bacterium]
MNIPVLLARKRHARAFAASTVALAAGAIILLRAPGGPLAAGVQVTTGRGPASSVTFSGPRLHGRIALSQGAVAANGARQVYAEVRLSADQGRDGAQARPVALAVVLDTSGSMAGDKILQARNAVLSLIEQMRDSDQIALVTYSDGRNLVQPLARVGDVRPRLRITIPTIDAAGGTMIPQALDLGASALAGAPAGFSRRVVLVSDGQDGSGQPLTVISGDVRRRAELGFTVSTLGVGEDYDDAFMTGIADAGRGNYEFLRDGSQLAGFLARELREAGATTVDQTVADVSLPAGWHLSHSFGAEASGTATHVTLPVGAMYAGSERTVVLDLTVDAGAEGTAGGLAATVHYRAVAEARDVTIEAGPLALRVVADESQALATRDLTVFAASESVALAQRQHDAVETWRRGDTARAYQMAQNNAQSLARLQAVAPSAALAAQASEYSRDADTFNSVSAGSSAGRSYGLRSNVSNRARQVRAISY